MERAVAGPVPGIHRAARPAAPSQVERTTNFTGSFRSAAMTTELTPYRRGMNLLESFREEMEDLFDRVTGDGRLARQWSPRVDVEETDKEIVVKADLPGVDPKDVDIQIQDNVLMLRGGKEEKKEEKKKNYHRIERFSGQFYRAIGLPAGADADKVTATTANGTVTVTIPKKAEAQPKKVAIKPQTA
jgi:HSP20 family protein